MVGNGYLLLKESPKTFLFAEGNPKHIYLGFFVYFFSNGFKVKLILS